MGWEKGDQKCLRWDWQRNPACFRMCCAGVDVLGGVQWFLCLALLSQLALVQQGTDLCAGLWINSPAHGLCPSAARCWAVKGFSSVRSELSSTLGENTVRFLRVAHLTDLLLCLTAIGTFCGDIS